MFGFTQLSGFKKASFNFNPFISKMKNDTLTLEEVLDCEEVIQELKSNEEFKMVEFFNSRVIRRLIDYAIKMPREDEFQVGYKYPFNACELLCCGNNSFIELLMKELNYRKKEKAAEEEDKDKAEEKKDDEERAEAKDKLGVKEEEYEAKDEGKERLGEIEQDHELAAALEGVREAQGEDVDTKEEVNGDKPSEQINANQKEASEDKQIETADQKEEEALLHQEQDHELAAALEGKIEGEAQGEEEENVKEELDEDKPFEQFNADQKDQETKLQLDLDTQLNEVADEDKEENVEIEEGEEGEEEEEEEEYILDYLFSFIQSTADSDNYVLSGYFYKIVTHFLEISPTILLNYLYTDHPEHLKNCIPLLTKKSIGDLVLKLLTYEDSFPKYDANKIEFLSAILNELSQSKDIELYEFAMDMLHNALSTPKLYDLILDDSSNLLEHLYALLCNSPDPSLFKPICSVLIKLNKLLLQSFPGQVTPKIQIDPSALITTSLNSDGFNNETTVEEEASLAFDLQLLFKLLKQTGFPFLEDLGDCDKTGEISETTYNQTQRRLGMKKLIQVEYIRSLIDVVVNSNAKSFYKEDIVELIQQLINAKVFESLIDIFFAFEMNNMYQLLFKQVIALCINEHCPIELIDRLFGIESLHLTGRLIDHIARRRDFICKSKRLINAASFSVTINLLSEIMNSSNAQLKALLSNQKDTVAFNEIVLPPVIAIFNQKLLLAEPTAFVGHFDSEPKEEKVKLSLHSLREVIEQNLAIYAEYQRGGDYKQLLIAKALKDKEEIEMDDNLNINVDMTEENIFEKRVSLENKGNEIFCGSPDVNYNEGGRPCMALPELMEECKSEASEGKAEDYFDNNYWKSSSADEEELSSLMKDLDL